MWLLKVMTDKFNVAGGLTFQEWPLLKESKIGSWERKIGKDKIDLLISGVLTFIFASFLVLLWWLGAVGSYIVFATVWALV